MKTIDQINGYRRTPHRRQSSGSEHRRKRAAQTRINWRLRPLQKAVCVICLLAGSAAAQQAKTDLTSKSVEDLINIEVTSVSKKEERLFQTAAAVYVITQEEIRRSGMTNIPELLRLVPGLEVARIDGNKWAITARGFNKRFANKLLVLVDGRSVYTPEFSGVYWEVQDLMLEDIERIEVIRGPGGTLWGANAVNGVINIITKRAEDTQGGLLVAGGGSEERGQGGLRYGGKLSDRAHYRVYGKYYNRAGLADAAGAAANDGQEAVRGGGRLDWKLNDRDTLMIEGDLYHTDLRETSILFSLHSLADPLVPPVNTRGEFNGGSLLGRWARTFSERSDMALQVYYDRFDRDIYDLSVTINTFDADFQHHVAMGRRHDLVWGLGYRLNADRIGSDPYGAVSYDPEARKTSLFSAFAQDEITLAKDRLRLTLGAKLEHNAFSGFEAQPSARLLWTPRPHQALWGAVSRAVRTPARFDHNLRVNAFVGLDPGNLPLVVAVFGDPGMKPETLLAYEFGYRIQPGRKLFFDLALFYNRYDQLMTLEPDMPFFEPDPLPHVVLPSRLKNLLRGATYGVEASANWTPCKDWKIHGSYAFLRMPLHAAPGSLDVLSVNAEGDSPRHKFQLRSYLTLPRNFELDASAYYVSRLSGLQIPGLPPFAAPAYARLDVRLGRRLSERLEVSLAAQNLLNGRHAEFAAYDISVLPSQVKRSVYGKLTWQF